MEHVLNKGLEFFKKTHVDKKIKKTSYKIVLYEILDKYWDKISMKPASVTGKYHHTVENMTPFGLVNHLIRVQYFNELLLVEENIPQNEWDKFFFVDYTHDLGKIFVTTKEEYEIHGVLGARAVMQHIAPLGDDVPEIYLMIKNHMHHWGKTIPVGINDRIVAYADFLASRGDIHINLNYLDADLFDLSEGEKAVYKTW